MERPALWDVVSTLREGGSISLPSPEDYEPCFIRARQREIAERERDKTDERFHRSVMSFVDRKVK